MTVEELAGMTLGDALRAQAQMRPDAPALWGDTRALTWGQLDAEVDQLAGLLTHMGVRKGDAVGFLITKRPEVVTGFLACARLGAIMAPINFKMHPDRLRFQVESANLRTLFIEREFDELLKPMLSWFTDPGRVLYVGEKGKYGDVSYADISRHEAPPPVDVTLDDPCYYNYTSGTTGYPKGAIATHRNVQQNGLTAFDRPGIDGLGFDASHVFLGMFSVFAHPHELFHRSILCGGAFVIVDTLNPRVIAETIQRFSVSWMMAVPSFYEMLLDHVEEDRFNLSSLRVLESGGAWVSPDTLARLEQKFGAAFMPVWGSTETTGVAVAMRPDRPRRPGSTGKPVAGYDLRIVDGQGRDVQSGEVGEMIVRGPAVVTGYINSADDGEILFHDGWYHTQDLVRCDEDGFIHFVGRRSEMLKIGGIRVYPLEIERVLKEHPEVRDCVVVRAEERIRGEIPRAIIQRTPGSTLDVRRLQRYCRDRLEGYKIPRIVEFWAQIPKLPNGKIDKAAVLAVPANPDRDDR
ncbi:acyl--CoA ligase [Myxococcota bacterium]|nr:acyl--CoA ligase [Myxococcota bacterium]